VAAFFRGVVLLASGFELRLPLVEFRLRHDALVEQRLNARELALRELDAALAFWTSGTAFTSRTELVAPVLDGNRSEAPGSTERGADEARLGPHTSGAFDVNAVPEVQNAKAAFELAQSEFSRIPIAARPAAFVSQSEFEPAEGAARSRRQQYDAAKNAATQQYQSLLAARARVTLRTKRSRHDRTRAFTARLRAQRVGRDYVTKA